MKAIFHDMPFVEVFIDNIMIGANDFEEHLKYVHRVVNRLDEYNFKLKASATNLCHAQIKLLGHVIDGQGIALDPSKVKIVMDWERPRDIPNLRAYLGFVTFLSDHVRHFADLAAPLYAVKGKTGLVGWTPQMIMSFDLIKQAIATAPWLAHADFSKQFVLATDSSNVGAGCILYQPDKDDKDLLITPYNIVGIYSKKYTETQRRYSTYKKELYAIVVGLIRFHSYLHLRKFIVFTDHAPLKFITEAREIPLSLQQWTDVLFELHVRSQTSTVDHACAAGCTLTHVRCGVRHWFTVGCRDTEQATTCG